MITYTVYLHKYSGQWDGEILYAGNNKDEAINIADKADTKKFYSTVQVEILDWIDGKIDKVSYKRKIR